MAQNATSIIDGIKSSIETVGRSGRGDVYLDNVSFRIDSSQLDVPHGSLIIYARVFAECFTSCFDPGDYNSDYGHVIFNFESSVLEEIVCLQVLPSRRTADGTIIDMTVTILCSDVVNRLPQVVLTCELVLHHIAEAVGAKAGRITFNVAHAYVLWDDVEQLVEWDEIEIPR